MRRFTFASVEDAELIFSHDDTVIFSGKHPWIFRKDGTYVAKLKSVSRAYDMVFLPGNMVLMDGLGDRGYHYISLDDGQTIWRGAKKRKRLGSPNELVASPDGKVIYYLYYVDSFDTLYIDHIEPDKEMYTTYTISQDFGAVRHAYCDNDGTLFMLRSYTKRNGNEDEIEDSTSYAGIMTWSPTNPNRTWKYHWEESTEFHPRACNKEHVLFNNLYAASLKTGEVINLLENSPDIDSWGNFSVIAYDSESYLLTVRYIGRYATLVIDCKARKVVAHYAPLCPGLSGGRLIDNEYWIGTFDGVIKRPFPHMDPLPKRFW